ncbi:zinc finger protein 277-like [Pocillopora damicornis]|uniref:zinc finger protein 277-like n=1 Tax=Pocillopora damicornis TaxID=46731 RepID=UPI000F54DAF5|nr:zinc finger protein 277-like [Pocillopora damicornis]
MADRGSQLQQGIKVLTFPEKSLPEFPELDLKVPCIFCEKEFPNTSGKNDAVLHHMLIEHQLVIGDVGQVCDLRRYLCYWKTRLKEKPITEVCPVININSKPDDIGPKIQYFLLCDSLPEDRNLREDLQRRRLEDVLECQQRERSDTHFSRGCLFCKQHFEGNRSSLFTHMASDHGFNVGLPDNLVNVNEFLDTLETKLTNLQCLFCEKLFKDRTALKDHMRKKQHKKINPKNKEYDRFYVINYLELGKTWEDIQNEIEEEEDVDSKTDKSDEEDWSDWKGDLPPCVCLFCESSSPATNEILQHMKEEHLFDFYTIKSSFGLDFYHQVKIVNYIRRQVYKNNCIKCQENFQDKVTVLEHMKKAQHFAVPEDRTVWDQPQYFFPTYENDALLCSLEDDEEDETEDRDDFAQNTDA